jgi:hypothetical protein
MCANRKNPLTPCIIVLTEETRSLAEVADVELEVCPLDADQRVQCVDLAPGEPAAQLVGVQRVGVPGVVGQVRHGCQLGRRQRIELNGSNIVLVELVLAPPAAWRP